MCKTVLITVAQNAFKQMLNISVHGPRHDLIKAQRMICKQCFFPHELKIIASILSYNCSLKKALVQTSLVFSLTCFHHLFLLCRSKMTIKVKSQGFLLALDLFLQHFLQYMLSQLLLMRHMNYINCTTQIQGIQCGNFLLVFILVFLKATHEKEKNRIYFVSY